MEDILPVHGTTGKMRRTVAIGGSGWLTRVPTAPQRVDRLLRSCGGTRIWVDTPGQTDINVYTDTQQMLDDATAYWEARRAAGWDFLLCTSVPDSSQFDATRGGGTIDEDQMRDDLNDHIEASVVPGVLLDAMIDWRVHPTMEDYTSGAFVDDGGGVYTHPTTATARDLMAPTAYDALAPFLTLIDV
jgi:hypothetical protein